MTTPAITPDSFPYRRKWRKAQIDEILERKDRIVEGLTDAVGPVGQMLYVPPDSLHILALHLALAGGEVREELAYIVAKIRPNEPGMFEDSREWVLKQEYEPAPPDPDKTAEKAKAAAEQIKRQLPPEVRAALMAVMADEYSRVTEQDTPTRREKAEAVLIEAEQRGGIQ